MFLSSTFLSDSTLERERAFWPDIKSLVMSGITVACLFLSEFMFPQVLEMLSNKPGYRNNNNKYKPPPSLHWEDWTHNLLVKAIICWVHTRLMKTEHWNYYALNSVFKYKVFLNKENIFLCISAQNKPI